MMNQQDINEGKGNFFYSQQLSELYLELSGPNPREDILQRIGETTYCYAITLEEEDQRVFYLTESRDYLKKYLEKMNMLDNQ